MGFTSVLTIYALGWVITAATLMIKMLYDGDAGNITTDLEEKLAAESPELVEFWNNDHNNIQMKTALTIAAVLVVFPIMLGSLWPLILVVLGFRLVNLVRRGES